MTPATTLMKMDGLSLLKAVWCLSVHTNYASWTRSLWKGAIYTLQDLIIVKSVGIITELEVLAFIRYPYWPHGVRFIVLSLDSRSREI